MRRPVLVVITLFALLAVAIGLIWSARNGSVTRRSGPVSATEASPTGEPLASDSGQPPLSATGPALPTPSTIAIPDSIAPLQEVVEGIYAADRDIEAPDGYRIRAVVVPHHLVAATTTAVGIKMLERQPPKKILLLSPDHFDVCPTLLCTADAAFRTALGDAPPAADLVAALKSSPLVTERPELFAREHGIGAILPFLAHYLPGVPVAPVVLSQRLPWKPSQTELLDLLAQAVDDDTALVLSSDFSHYQTLTQADRLDEATAETLFARDLGGLASLKQPDQSDCPGGLWLLAALADRRGFYNPSVVLHTNSARLLNDLKARETTSHFALVWYENARLDGSDLAVAGDLTVTRGVPRSLPKAALDWWAGAGPRLVNLEGPLAESCTPNDNIFMFCNLVSRWTRVNGLATLFGLMNNHMLDLGAAGLAETERLVRAGGKTPVTSKAYEDDRYRLVTLTGLMNPVPDAAAARITATRNAVLEALKKPAPGKLTIVYVHDGDEYSALATDDQTARWERLIDDGADAVVVAHAHEPSDIFIYKGKPIFRGLGNFLFDQYDRGVTQTAKLVRLRLEGDHVLFETLVAPAR